MKSGAVFLVTMTMSLCAPVYAITGASRHRILGTVFFSARPTVSAEAHNKARRWCTTLVPPRGRLADDATTTKILAPKTASPAFCSLNKSSFLSRSTSFALFHGSRTFRSSSFCGRNRRTASVVPFATTLVGCGFILTLSTTTTSFSCEASSSVSTTTRLLATASTATATVETGYLNAKDAYQLDEELMAKPIGFTLEQLMELAGLAVAEAVYQVLVQDDNDDENSTTDKKKNILIVCGPGNNGGDGLVAARHLFHFFSTSGGGGGANVQVVYPKRPYAKQPHYEKLVKQCLDLGIQLRDDMPPESQLQDYHVVVDAIFGFSFSGEPREPFRSMLETLTQLSSSTTRTRRRPWLVSVDVPSGWNVDGEEHQNQNAVFQPDVLISLTAPKLCAQHFPGRHFVGGRFLPPALAQKYNIQMPPYPGTSQVMEVTASKLCNENKEADS